MKLHAKLRFTLMLPLVHDKKCPSLCVPVGMQKIGCPQSDLMLRNYVIRGCVRMDVGYGTSGTSADVPGRRS